MRRIKEKLKSLLEGAGIILIMWMAVSAGMAELVGESGGVLWGALITGIVLFSVYVYNQEKNKSYNREVNMNKKNLQMNNLKRLQPQEKSLKKAQKSNWGDEMRDSFNKKLHEGRLPGMY